MDTNIFSVLYKKLNKGKSSVLIRIIQHEGSTPRGVGSSCLVDEAGEVFGTIGGGLVEYRAIEKAKHLLLDGLTSVSTFKMSSKEIEEEGMICGGRVKLFFEPVLAGDKIALEFFGNVNQLLKKREQAVLATRISDGSHASIPGTRMLVTEHGNIFGTLPGFSSLKQVHHTQIIRTPDGKTSALLEPIVQQPELILFGAGHVSTCVAPLAKMVGFRVRVIDDRSEFANKDRFPEADDIKAMPYSDVFEQLGLNQHSYLVIVTRGHSMDKDVLELALKLDISPAYIGMIGSRRKRDTIYNALMEGGIDQKSLAEVYSPIGLDIGAQTPEEIAVSIIGEIIKVRAGRCSTTDVLPMASVSGVS